MMYNSRKIFFLDPATEWEKYLLTDLVRNEYEAHPVFDINVLLKALTFFDRSIVCINTLNREEEASSIYSIIKKSPDLEDAAVCTYYLKDGLLTFNRENSSFEPPVENLRIDSEEGKELIWSMLENASVRGLRNYIRIHCPEMDVSHIGLQIEGEFYTGRIKDISRAGLSCCMDKMGPIKKGAVVEDVTIRLHNLRFKCDCISAGFRIQARKVYQILLFKRLELSDKMKLGDYIYESMQSRFERIVYTLENLYSDVSLSRY